MMRSNSIAVVVLSFLAGAVLADYRDNYRQAVQAFERQEWPEAARLLRLAMSEKPRDEDSRIQVPGTGRIAYVPNALLAVTLMRQNDCQRAIPHIQAAQDQGISASLAPNYHRLMVAGRDSCANQLVTASTEETKADIAAGRKIFEQLDGLFSRGDLQPFLAQEPELGQRLKRNGAAVENANSLLEMGLRSRMLPALRDARQSARIAKGDLESLHEDVASHLRSAVGPAVAEAEAAIVAADRALEQLRRLRDDPTARRVWNANSQLGERTRRSSEQLEGAKSSLATARKARDPGSIGGIISAANEATATFTSLADEGRRLAAAAARRVAEPEPTVTAAVIADDTGGTVGDDIADTGTGDTGTGDTGPSPTPTTGPVASAPLGAAPGEVSRNTVPEVLRTAAGAYFRGEYAAVLEALAEPSFSSARATAQAHLFRAASGVALYRLGGEIEAAFLVAAREDAARSLEADSSLVVDSSYFPPAVVQLFAAATP